MSATWSDAEPALDRARLGLDPRDRVHTGYRASVAPHWVVFRGSVAVARFGTCEEAMGYARRLAEGSL